MAPYRPPGRSNRSGRTNADNDVFEGLPVKQWGQSYCRVSLAPQRSEAEAKNDDKWGEPPLPRDYQLLNPWTQHLLRLARSGKVGTKRKQEPDLDDDKPEDEVAEEQPTKKSSLCEERVYVAKKWKPIPEHALEPEHKHFNFLAKRRRGLPSLYGPDNGNGVAVPMRKTKVQITGANGEAAIYEVLVPEGQVLEGEIADMTELADVKSATAAPGTVIDGVGVANEEGVVVAEHLRPNAPRRNRPPIKKKGGPGRGKKRVTFTNPDGSTYTTIVPNATKIVPQPGQTVKHVAKGEEAGADVSAGEVAKQPLESQNGEDGEDDDDDDEEGDDDDDREEGELSDEDAPATGNQTPAKSDSNLDSQSMEDVRPTAPAPTSASGVGTIPNRHPSGPVPAPAQAEEHASPFTLNTSVAPSRDASSSPEMPLAKSHGRIAALAEPAPMSLDAETLAAAPPLAQAECDPEAVASPDRVPAGALVAEGQAAVLGANAAAEAVVVDETENFEDGDDDLLGNLEKHLGAAGENDTAV